MLIFTQLIKFAASVSINVFTSQRLVSTFRANIDASWLHVVALRAFMWQFFGPFLNCAARAFLHAIRLTGKIVVLD